jgi:hypothetical protein
MLLIQVGNQYSVSFEAEPHHIKEYHVAPEKTSSNKPARRTTDQKSN